MRRSDAETIAAYETFATAILDPDPDKKGSIKQASKKAGITRRTGTKFMKWGAFTKPGGPQLRPPVADLIAKRDREAVAHADRDAGWQRLILDSQAQSSALVRAKQILLARNSADIALNLTGSAVRLAAHVQKLTTGLETLDVSLLTPQERAQQAGRSTRVIENIVALGRNAVELQRLLAGEAQSIVGIADVENATVEQYEDMVRGAQVALDRMKAAESGEQAPVAAEAKWTPKDPPVVPEPASIETANVVPINRPAAGMLTGLGLSRR